MKELPVREFRSILRHFERELGIQNQSGCCCGVTITQCHVLMELDRSDNITLNELSSRLSLDKSTVSRTVETLVNNGLIDRTIPKSNRRTTLITLSKNGKKTCKTINSGNDRYYRKVLSAIPAGDRTSFLGGFKSMARAMELQNTSRSRKI